MEKGAADKSNTFTSNFLITPTLLCYQSKSVHTWKKKFYSVSPRGSAAESFVQNEAARSQTLLAATNRYNQSSFAQPHGSRLFFSRRFS